MVRVRRLLLPALLGLAGYFALFGGEYSVFEVRRTRAQIADESGDVERLRDQIGSLEARADSLENDPLTLERVARESFGMVGDDEVLYRFVEPADSADSGSGSGGS